MWLSGELLYTDLVGGCNAPHSAPRARTPIPSRELFFLPCFLFFLFCLYFRFLKSKTFKKKLRKIISQKFEQFSENEHFLTGQFQI
jgi:hypothetical protein